MHLISKTVCGFLTMIVAATSAMAASPKPVNKTANTKTAEIAFDEHKVKKGETLWGIAQKHSTSVGEIMDCNRLPNETVREGITLKIPRRNKEVPIKLRQAQEPESIKDVATPFKSPAQKSVPSGMIAYTVAEDDTFYSIGKKYGVTMQSVVTANSTIKPEQLREGMKIVVPQVSPAKVKTLTIQAEETKTKKPLGDALITPAKKNPEIATDKTKAVPALVAITSSESKKVDANAKQAVTSSKPVMIKTADLTPKIVNDDGVIRSYIVSAGEDENTISEAFGITRKQLLEYNRLNSSTNLKPGDEIMIPRVVK